MGYTSKKVIFHLKLKFPTFWVGNSLQFFFPIRPSKSLQLGKFPTYRNTGRRIRVWTWSATSDRQRWPQRSFTHAMRRRDNIMAIYIYRWMSRRGKSIMIFHSQSQSHSKWVVFLSDQSLFMIGKMIEIATHFIINHVNHIRNKITGYLPHF